MERATMRGTFRTRALGRDGRLDVRGTAVAVVPLCSGQFLAVTVRRETAT
jgi:hypothetical protein